MLRMPWLAVVMLACAVALPAQADDSPLKIGILTNLSGPLGTSGQKERDGFLFYVAQHGGKLGGRSIETVTEDIASDPSAAIVKARKLVGSDHVDVILGPNDSATSAAIKSYLTETGVPTLLLGTVDELVNGKNIFRTSFPANPDGFLSGAIAGKAGFRKAITVAPNYNAGQASLDYFEKGFTAAGGKVIQRLMPRLGAPDYGAIISQFSSDADALIIFMTGSDAVRFLKQNADYGNQLPMYGFPVTVDETLLPAEGDSALGFVGAAPYFSSVDTPENKALIESWTKAKPGQAKPSWLEFGGIVAAQVLDAALPNVKGSDKEAIVAAIKQVKIVTAAGPFRFNENNDPISPRYIMQIRKTNGVLGPVVLGVIPEFQPVPALPVWPAGLDLPH